jgi:non-specific serine/threonine protein kinase
LRRLKTDKSIIADLPDKTEVKTFCPLSRKQAALYQQVVDDLANQLENVEGIERRGIVLAFLMRLKQICNHPSQWLGDGAWAEEDSGKLTRLRDIAEVLGARQEKALVFTQFKETTAPLAAFLGSVFGRPGLILHGETEVRKRKDLVRQFQEDERVPFFVLSVGRRHRPQSPRRRTSSISIGGESGRRKPGHRPRLHWAEQECACAQVHCRGTVEIRSTR